MIACSVEHILSASATKNYSRVGNPTCRRGSPRRPKSRRVIVGVQQRSPAPSKLRPSLVAKHVAAAWQSARLHPSRLRNSPGGSHPTRKSGENLPMRHDVSCKMHAIVRIRWSRELLDVDPLSLVPRQRCRILIVHGENDEQIPSSHADALARACASAGHDYRVTILPSRDHLFRQNAADTKADGVVRSDAGAAVAQAIAAGLLSSRPQARARSSATCKS
jgi:pimeloyl-ACP methyl ester carboxylesterase